MTVIVRTTQQERFQNELQDNAKRRSRREQHSRFHCLDLFVDRDGVLRVGGRLRRAELEYGERHSAILPRKDHVSKLIVRHYHERVYHQGRSITRGALRQAGYWIVGGHQAVSKEIHACMKCKKLQGRPVQQKMADLPNDRMKIAAPFTHTRKTRGGMANSKVGGIVFTCLASRAVHVELIDSMDASAFIFALRRFYALRGQASLLRCDRGTNFLGGRSEMKEEFKKMDLGKVERFVVEQVCR